MNTLHDVLRYILDHIEHPSPGEKQAALDVVEQAAAADEQLLTGPQAPQASQVVVHGQAEEQA